MLNDPHDNQMCETKGVTIEKHLSLELSLPFQLHKSSDMLMESSG